MADSTFFAKFLGVYLAVFGIAFLLNKKQSNRVMKALLEGAGLQFYIGMITTLLGAFIVVKHNIWVRDWPVIITILGWITLLKGIGYTLSTKQLMTFGKKFVSIKNIHIYGGGSWTILGAVLIYFGYIQ
ncbi:hypothetical protein JYT19_00090 [Sulfobacillus acidophilus]|uniref:Uncharacterized protein n=1 Tax=Sulfobacillus acidophilus TaxID=53633 RepID=A0ABS3AVP0_9FIRM|nr:hypothetical protein [Sulfobacillus acidophilus]